MTPGLRPYIPESRTNELAVLSLHSKTWLLGGSWAVISGVINKATRVITHIRGLITMLITTHEPPSSV